MSIRERERERRQHDYGWNEVRAVQRQRVRQLFDDAPRVIRYDDVPGEQVHQAYHKIFTGDNLTDAERKLRRAPIYTMSARLQILESGYRSGNHRHYPEARVYVLEGQGHEVHDNKRWDRGPGDLAVVPPTMASGASSTSRMRGTDDRRKEHHGRRCSRTVR